MNNVCLLGRLTKDPDELVTGSGTAVARFSLAVDRPKDKDGNRSADFISCVAFGKTAETIQKYTSKGRMIALQGRLQTGSFEKDGKKTYTTDVVVDRFFFADSKQNGAEGNVIPLPKVENKSSVPEGFSQLTDDDVPF